MGRVKNMACGRLGSGQQSMQNSLAVSIYVINGSPSTDKKPGHFKVSTLKGAM